MSHPSGYFRTSPAITHFAVMMNGGVLLSLRNVDNMLHKRVIDVSQKAVQLWRNRPSLSFANHAAKQIDRCND